MSNITEECGCAADFRIDDPKELWTTAAIDEAVTNWRTTHVHAPVAEAGRCMEIIPSADSAIGTLSTILCRLRHGHAGAHEDADRATWFHRDALTEVTS